MNEAMQSEIIKNVQAECLLFALEKKISADFFDVAWNTLHEARELLDDGSIAESQYYTVAVQSQLLHYISPF